MKSIIYSYIRKKWGKKKYAQELLEGKTKLQDLEYNLSSK